MTKGRSYWYIYGTPEGSDEELVYKFPTAICEENEVKLCC